MEKQKQKMFTKDQRTWILERDGNRCQMRIYKNGIWQQCTHTVKLECHHILPRGFASIHKPNWDCNSKDNLIMICDHHHRGVNMSREDVEKGFCLHPDCWYALAEYRMGDRNAFNRLHSNRLKMNEAGVPYWNTGWDWMLQRIIEKNNSKLILSPYPERITRKK